MNKEFIPYEQALELKELGFNIFFKDFYYNYKGNLLQLVYYEEFADIKMPCPAPLYQQSFRWFREKYNIIALVMVVDDNEWGGSIREVDKNGGVHTLMYIDNPTPTYEEAEFRLLKELIEIVKKDGKDKS